MNMFRPACTHVPSVWAPQRGLDEGPVGGGVEGEEAGHVLRGEGAPVVLDRGRGAGEALGQEPSKPVNGTF